jgi:hypothetical protein
MAPSVDPTRPGAYAVSTESKGEPVFFALTVPPGVAPGGVFTFRAGERRGLSARCPAYAKVSRRGTKHASLLLDIQAITYMIVIVISDISREMFCRLLCRLTPRRTTRR